jgi:hypothetical protein
VVEPHPQAYRYADPGDQLTSQLIAHSGLSDLAWELQESAVLDIFGRRLAALPHRHRLLDFGSGLGRLTVTAAGWYDHVVSVEPDPDRARGQAGVVAESPAAGRIEIYLAMPPVPLDGPRYDAAICSHVLQHVDDAAADAILAQLAGAVQVGGHLILLSAFSGSWRITRHVVDRLDPHGQFQELPISRAEFNQVCQANIAGYLPIHLASLSDLYRQLTVAGFTPCLAYGFHGLAGVVGPLPTEPPPTDADRGPDATNANLGSDPLGGLSSCRDVAILAARQ